MKICFLTQTAHDISDYYKEFFRNHDLFFITFKSFNSNAIGFLPKSTWSDGRNMLWERVKGQYDYYVFIDDDLKFMNFESFFSKSALAGYVYHKLFKKKFSSIYHLSKPGYFFSRLSYYLNQYLPEVLSVTQLESMPTARLDTAAMRKNSFVRRVGFFDAQFTVLSNFAATKILPYDISISGWWSAQIPVYLYAFHVFASKAINISELAVTNDFHSNGYVENYDGVLDCKKMVETISMLTKKNYSNVLSQNEKEAIDFLYGSMIIQSNIPNKKNFENYSLNFSNTLKGIEEILPAMKL